MKMTSKSFVLGAVLSLSALPLGQTATISYNSAFSDLAITGSASSDFGINALYTDTGIDSSVFSLPKFDPALGTLNSVTFTIALSDRTTDAAFSQSGVSLAIGAISLDRSLSLTVDGIGGSVASGTANLSGAPLAALLGIALSPAVATNGSIIDNPAVSGLATAAITDSPSLAAVTGPGTFDLTLSGSDTYSFSTLVSIGTASWGGTTDYSGLGSVSFDYTAVPEPSTGTAVLLAAAALIAVRHRRRSGKNLKASSATS
ncbi:MAG: choice-of-anchor E domain-containing protein [Chthoniobacterales bacterium]